MKASELDLVRPYYVRGDYVWLITPRRICEGIVLKAYQGNRGKATKNYKTGTEVYLANRNPTPWPMYHVFTLFGADFDQEADPRMCRRPNSAHVRASAIVPRHRWEERPLQRLEPLFNQEITLERLQQLLKDANIG